MSSTNKTANYELSQFVGTDIPSILNDYNGDMRKIDTAIKAVATAEGGSQSDIAGLQATVGQHTTEISGLSSTVNSLSGRVIGIEGKIPANASADNQLATADDITQLTQNVTNLQTNVGELQGEVSDIGDDVKDIQLCVPANASESNKLATMSDVGSGWTLALNNVEISDIVSNTAIQTAIANFMTTYANRIASGEIIAKAFVGSSDNDGSLSYHEYTFGLQKTAVGNYAIDLTHISGGSTGLDVEAIQVQGPSGYWGYSNYETLIRADSTTIQNLGTGNIRYLSIFVSE